MNQTYSLIETRKTAGPGKGNDEENSNQRDSALINYLLQALLTLIIICYSSVSSGLSTRSFD